MTWDWDRFWGLLALCWICFTVWIGMVLPAIRSAGKAWRNE